MSKIQAFTMPKWGIEMTEGALADWMVGEGDAFKRGQVLALIETEKITNEVEAETESVLRRIVVPKGEIVPVGTLLAVFAGSDVPDREIDAFVRAFRPAEGSEAAIRGPQADGPAAPAAPPTPAAPPPAVEIPPDLAISPRARAHALAHQVDVRAIAGSGRKGRVTFQDVEQATRLPVDLPSGPPVSNEVKTMALEQFFASPLAKRLALQHGIDLAKLGGTGPRGRIRKADVLARIEPSKPEAKPVAEAPRPPGAEVEVVRMSLMRKAIAKQLTRSKTTIPHFYLRAQVRVDALQAMRERARQSTGAAPSLNDYLLRACALALKQCPDVNVQVHGDDIHRFAHADISVAVATDKGLITPILRAAETKSVAQIASEVRSLIERARAGKLQAADIEGGSFSLSNLGMFGIDQFDAIINPPQGAILAVGAVRRVPVETDYALTFASVLSMSLSCDHRAIDGAVGAKFMQVLRGYIEQPADLVQN